MPKIWVASQRCHLEYRWLPQVEKHAPKHKTWPEYDLCPGSGSLVEPGDTPDGLVECPHCGVECRVLNMPEEE